MVPRARLFGRDARLSAARALVAWLLASSLALARALAPHPHRRLDVRPTALREHLTRGRAVGPGGFRSASAGFPGDAPKERWVTQPLDHFDPTDVVAAETPSFGRGDDPHAWDAATRASLAATTRERNSRTGRTWRQRWFANDAFFDRARFRSPNDARSRYERASDLPDPVVFLCVGGEGPGFDADVVVTGGPHCASAVGLARSLFLKKKGGALLVALEHRFYGKSQPTGELTVESLRYLTSDQALADAARFVGEVAAAFGLAGTQTDAANGRQSALSFLVGKKNNEKNPRVKKIFPRVVAFGGSYPGMLAGWLRMRYPHLVVAAVASSAPVRASLAMPGYDAVVGEALAEPDVGGSETCLWVVARAFGEVARLMLDFDGRRRLETMFNVCSLRASSSSRREPPLERKENRAEFLAALTEIFPAQSNDPACDRAANAACDIRGACAIMTNLSSSPFSGSIHNIDGSFSGASATDRIGFAKTQKKRNPTSSRDDDDASLRNLARVARAAFGTDACVDADHAANLAFLNVTTLPADWRAYDGDRAWFWQTCVEFGFYQTCDDDGCPFFSNPSRRTRTSNAKEDAFGGDGGLKNETKRLLSLDFFAEPCASLFGLDLNTVVFPAAKRSNGKTGGITPGGSRVMYPSGSVDPWRANSFTPDLAGSIPHRSEKAVSRTLPSLMVQGASHHAWTHPARDTDQASVVKARESIAAQVEKWLDETDATKDGGFGTSEE